MDNSTNHGAQLVPLRNDVLVGVAREVAFYFVISAHLTGLVAQDLVAVRHAAKTEEYLIEPYIAGVEATCAVLEQSDGSVIALPPIEIVPADGGFDYVAKYLAKSTQEICPGRFAPETTDEIKDQALRAHQALSCVGYSRSDFIVSDKGPIYLETNTLPGLTKASLYPKALKAQGIEFADFLHDQIKLAAQRARK